MGLTLVYAISGVAVNHVRDWNPNYRVTSRSAALPEVVGEPGTDTYGRALVGALGLDAAYRGTFRPDAGTVQVFLDGGSVTAELATGRADIEIVQPRRILRPLNVLHLNDARRLWTWFADAYAVSLVLLAITGMFVIKGKKGITGRGAWLTGLGAAIPIVFLLLYL